MGRHADTRSPKRLPRIAPRLLIPAGVVVLLLAGGGVWWAAGSSTPACPATERVRVTVSPEIAAAARTALKNGVHTADGTCVTAAVTAQEPLQTVGSLGALGAASLPQVWVPDASIWAARAAGSHLTAAGSMASSPVIVATSRAAADQLGWTKTPPTWGQALSGGTRVALPDLAADAEGLEALGAVRTSLGGTADADNAVVAAVLSSARSSAPSTADALAAARAGNADAPLVPVTEQSVVAAGSGNSSLVPVYPSDGSPRLDYPVLRVGSPAGHQKAAVDAVVGELTSAAEQAAVRAAGFRDPSGGAPKGAGADGVVPTQAPKDLPLDNTALTGLLTRLSALSKPSRLLTVMDVSTSMKAVVDGSGTRATLARDATKSALTLLPDSYAGGLWIFAYHLQGTQDYQELAPIRAFGADAGGGLTQRQLLQQQFDSIPGRLAGGGTALYDTTLAAVRASRQAYDPTEVSSVVLITDGKNEDDTGIALDQLLTTLKAEADPSRPVKVIGIGLGPDADMDALKQIADTTGGAAYQALHPQDLQSVLFDAIRRRG